YLLPGEGEGLYKTWTCGWNFVNAAMSKGLRLVNIPESIRNEKIYMYPNDGTAKLLKNLDALYDIMPSGNISQNRVLLYWVTKKLGLSDHTNKRIIASYQSRKAAIFIYNTELLNPDPGW